MLTEANFQFRIAKKQAWIRGNPDNAFGIPIEPAEIEDVVFVRGVLAYQVRYQSGMVAYILQEEWSACEIFKLEDKMI